MTDLEALKEARFVVALKTARCKAYLSSHEHWKKVREHLELMIAKAGEPVPSPQEPYKIAYFDDDPGWFYQLAPASTWSGPYESVYEATEKAVDAIIKQSPDMTEVEALTMVAAAAELATTPSDPKDKKSLLCAKLMVRGLIKQVEQLGADTDAAGTAAIQVLFDNGVVVTQVVDREWVIRYMAQAHMEPTRDQLVDVGRRIVGCCNMVAPLGDVDYGFAVGPEEVQVVIDTWMKEHWDV